MYYPKAEKNEAFSLTAKATHDIITSEYEKLHLMQIIKTIPALKPYYQPIACMHDYLRLHHTLYGLVNTPEGWKTYRLRYCLRNSLQK